MGTSQTETPVSSAGTKIQMCTHTKQQVTSQKHLDIHREELDEEEAGHTEQCNEHCKSVSESLRQWASDLKTQNVSNLHST